ncbi:MAG: STAS domain-containing protein [Candidatus Brocadiae bacterium]|nr:STAS domain-containing protein [Candidatus Brocadiia bacterium]
MIKEQENHLRSSKEDWLSFRINEAHLDHAKMATVEIIGSLETDNAKKFEDQLTALFNQEIKNLILNFSGLRFINSGGIGSLVQMVFKFKEAEGSVKLVELPEKFMVLFDMLGLVSLLEIYGTEKEAMNT